MSCVLQQWVCNLPWKQQSVLLSGLRGPDTLFCPNIKIVTRWIRNVTQKNADPFHSYMQIDKLPAFKDLEKELEFVSVHYLHHLSQALKVIAIGCDMVDTRTFAYLLYNSIAVQLLHVYPEPDATFYERLKDKVNHE